MKSLFYGRISIDIATALLRFEKKGITQRLMHQLKYKGHQELGTFFGDWLGEELTLNEKCPSFDMVIPVPLHKLRLKKRGYNQVEGFGKAIASKHRIPYRDDVLLKKTKTRSQVFKQRFKRILSVTDGEGVFLLDRPEIIENKHILLVDDIVTTGATLENCALELQKAKGIRISFATIAMA
jgi:predicted amidophosphoribosyltransferase